MCETIQGSTLKSWAAGEGLHLTTSIAATPHPEHPDELRCREIESGSSGVGCLRGEDAGRVRPFVNSDVPSNHELRLHWHRQMPTVSQDAVDELGVPTADALQMDVVIELQCQKFGIGKEWHEFLIPGTEVGHISEGPGAVKQVAFAFDPKAKRRPSIVGDRKRLHAQRSAERLCLVGGI